MQPRVELLGHIVVEVGIHVNDAKIRVIRDATPSKQQEGAEIVHWYCVILPAFHQRIRQESKPADRENIRECIVRVDR